ncbi:MAG: hypothetical protein OHK0039_48000 [Bacteroidia bacterium]
MRLLALYMILTMGLLGPGDPVREARRAFGEGQYAASLAGFDAVRRSYPASAQYMHYNMAQCYLHMDSMQQAAAWLMQAMQGRDSVVAAAAANAWGVLLAEGGQLRDAKDAFRQALRFDGGNEAARYNYELVSSLYQEPPQPETPPQEDQPDEPEADPELPEEDLQLPDKEMQELVDRLREQSRQRRLAGDAFRPIGYDTLTPMQARQVLEQLRQRELQFVQQLRKRSSSAGLRKDRTPDW